MKKALLGLAIVQLAALSYLFFSKSSATAEAVSVPVKLYVEMPRLEDEVVQVTVPKAAKKKTKKFAYFIPQRRINNGSGVELDKNINALETLGEAFFENPLMIRGLEKLVRNQFYNFYSDFINEADLSPYEQAELFRLMAKGMQDNLKSMMKALGGNMGQMRDMFRNGPPPELLAGVKENNMLLKEGLISSIGEDKFMLFEQYHKEKSAAEDYMRFSAHMKRSKKPLDETQQTEMRQIFLDNQHSPFTETTYDSQLSNEPLHDQSGDVLSEAQHESFKKTRKKHKRVYLLPF